MPTLTNESVKDAVEIAKAGMPLNVGTMIINPEAVAKFIEVVATKLHELRMNPNASKY